MAWDYLLYLFYGLAFFTLGVSIFSRDTRLSELGIARIIWTLAVFGLVHGIHEWLDFLAILEPSLSDGGVPLWRLLIVAVSYIFLLYFGLFLLLISFCGDKVLETFPVVWKLAVAAGVAVITGVTIYSDYNSNQDRLVRLLLGLPGGLGAGAGLLVYSRAVKQLSQKVANHFVAAGVCMIFYAFFTGAIPSGTIVPVFEVHIILFRGLSAFLVTGFTIRALSVFSVEQQELINEKLQRFSQSEKLASMGILAAGIAHEINNPLTNVQLNIEMLRDYVDGDDRVAKKLDAIDRNVTRAAKIAGELLHFSREKESKLLKVDLGEIVKRANHLLQQDKRSSVIRYELETAPKIRGIPWKLEEVVINLLLNSLDACAEGGDIVVRLNHVDNRVHLSVSDTGHGIPGPLIGKVFDPFFTTKEIGQGTGLGLSVCYNIVKQHDGEIALRSTEGVQTTVDIFFPVESDEF